MTSLQEVRRVVQARLDKFQPAQRSWDAYLGDGNGTINDESQPFHTYVRYPAANSPATSITNTRVPAQIENLRIKVGYLPEQPTLLQVLSVVPDQRLDDAGDLALLPTHAPTHTYGGSDPVYVVWRQIADFRLYATGGLQVTLQGGIATIAGTVTTISTQLVDLTDSVPATGARWSLISIKSTGAVTVTDGTPQTTATALTFAHIPATPSGEWRIWAIKLQASQTVIDESRLFVDTLDLRWPQNVGAGSVALSDLAAGSAQYQYLTTGATPFTPAWSSGYLNITAAKTLSATGTLTLTPSSDGLMLTVPATITALGRDANIAAGRVAFGSDSNTVSGDAGLAWDNTNKRLGIGTYPVRNLHVLGNTVDSVDLRIENSSATGLQPFGQLTQYGPNAFGVSDWPNAFVFEGQADGGLVLGAYGKGIKFQTNNRNLRMVIDTAGLIGINTALLGSGVTYQQLNVNGSALFVGTSSVQEREMMALTQSFVVSTDASRTTRTVWNQYDTAAREIMRGESSGSAPLIGFLGANAIARYSSTGDLRQALIDFGLYTTGGASPLDLNGGLLTAGRVQVNQDFIHLGTTFESGDSSPKFGAYTLTIPATGTTLLRDANIAAGRVAFGSDANTVSGDAQLIWDSTNKRLGVGVLSPEVDFEVAKDDVSIFFLKSFHASAFPIITGFRARGTHTAPTATLTGDQFLQLGGAGYGATAFPYANASELWFEAAEDWSDTNQGSLLRLRTTPIGSTVASQRDGILIDGYSNVTVPNGNLFVSVGRVGIGSTSINNTAVMINKTFTATDATFASILNAGGVITSASGQNVWGFIAQPLAIMTDPTASTIFGSFLVSETLTKPTVGQTLGTYAGLYLTIPATTGAGTGTITKAATAFIAGPPTAGVTNLSLDVESGVSYFGGKVGLGTTNPQGTLEISKTGADPANSGSTQNSYIRFQYSGGIVGGDIGVAGSAPWGLWIQSRFSNDFSQNNALSLNPNGGNVSIGTMQRGTGVTYQRLSVNGSQLFVGADSSQESPMLQIVPSYVVNTHASYTTRTVLSQWDIGGAREALRFETGSSAAMIGFLGANAIARYSSTGDLRQALIDFGLYTTGGASPLDLNGGLLTAGSIAQATLKASGVHKSTSITYISGVGTAGTDNTAQTVKSLTLAANTLTQVGDRLRIRAYWTGDNGSPITGSCKIGPSGSEVLVSHTTDGGAATLQLNEVWMHYIDNTHANIIENEAGALGALSAPNVAGFTWNASQDIIFTQDAIANNHTIIYALIVDVFPKGV